MPYREKTLASKPGERSTTKAPNESNHRLNGIEYTVMGSIFDNSQGLIKPGTLITKWIAKQLDGIRYLDATKIKTNMDSAIEDMDETIEKATKTENQCSIRSSGISITMERQKVK